MHYATKEWSSKSRHTTTHQQPQRAIRVLGNVEVKLSLDDTICKFIRKKSY